MKIFLKVALLLLWLTITSNAQSPRSGSEPDKSTAEIPTMQEWWRADGISNGLGMSYLPNFKDGHDALVVTTHKGMQTWLNRFPGDTQNVFTWTDKREGYHNYSILFGDFNGDGIRDYIDGAGNIYRGIQDGQPPEKNPVRKYSLAGLRKVFDFNNDGFDDIYEDGTTILYGGSDLANLIESSGGQSSSGNVGSLGEIYKTAQGEFRFIVQNTKAKSYDGYDLYRAMWEKGGTTPVFEKLDSIRQSLFSTQKDFFYINGFQTLYQSKKNGEPFFIATESLDGNWSNIIRTNIVIFDLSNDKFTEHLKFRMDSIAMITVLEHSIDGDEYEDWLIRKRQIAGINTILFFSRGDNFNDSPVMQYSTCQAPYINSIGDRTGDGISEVAIGSYCFAILKGMDLTTSISSEETQPETFSIGEPVPQPVTASQVSLVPVSVTEPAQYTLFLYSVEGKYIAQLFTGFLQEGTQKFPLHLSTYSIPSGSYVLRLSNGRQSAERTIIITN